MRKKRVKKETRFNPYLSAVYFFFRVGKNVTNLFKFFLFQAHCRTELTAFKRYFSFKSDF
jgi:hypothetical protein